MGIAAGKTVKMNDRFEASQNRSGATVLGVGSGRAASGFGQTPFRMVATADGWFADWPVAGESSRSL